MQLLITPLQYSRKQGSRHSPTRSPSALILGMKTHQRPVPAGIIPTRRRAAHCSCLPQTLDVGSRASAVDLESVSTQGFDQPVYTVAAAAELLRVSPRTLGRWLDGDKYRGRVHPPIIRIEPTGSSDLTWAEFVEAGLLAQYRRELSVRLQEIRTVVAALRETYGDPYPLAFHKPWEGPNRRLLVQSQQLNHLSEDLWLVAPATGQPLLLPPADAFLRRVDWSGNEPIAWRPHDDPRSPVRCRPDFRGGRPSINGISTIAIFEHIDGGEPVEDVAEDFNLSTNDAHWALAYEVSHRAPVAA